MKKEYTEQEINWKSISKCVDIDTGEIITEITIKTENYVKINSKVHRTVYKKTGTVEWTNEYRRSNQLTLW